MTSPIVRVYDTAEQAQQASAKLREKGLPENLITLITPESAPDALASAVRTGRVASERAEAYGAHLRDGRSLVAVSAPFGLGREVLIVLERYHPTATGLESALGAGPTVGWDMAAPFSSAIVMPTLWRGRATPLSSLIGFSPLARQLTFDSMMGGLTSPDWTFSSKFGMGLLSKRQTYEGRLGGVERASGKTGDMLRSRFALPLLSRNPAPLSSALGLEVKKEKQGPNAPAPFSAYFGFGLLSSRLSVLSRMFRPLASPRFALFGRNPLTANPAPLSSLIGQSTLIDSPTPLSSRLGRAVLSSNPAPLSSKFSLGLLSSGAAPLSAVLCLPVLTRYQ
jgi:hypothetical protein